MTPDGIEEVELSDHVTDERLPGIEGVDATLITERLIAAAGDIYKDLDAGDDVHHYNMYLPDKQVVIAYVVYLSTRRQFTKQAVVQSVFPVTERSAGTRFAANRWRLVKAHRPLHR